MTRRRMIALGCIGVLLCACAPALAKNKKNKEAEPTVVVVQHILIAFKRSVPGKDIERKKKDAQVLAEELFETAKAASEEEFDALVKEHTDDNYPGIYRLANKDAPLMPKARGRDDMVPGFGDVAFTIEIGEVGLVWYSAYLSPYGWHIIRRLE